MNSIINKNIVANREINVPQYGYNNTNSIKKNNMSMGNRETTVYTKHNFGAMLQRIAGLSGGCSGCGKNKK